jgi:hypothetical protein
MWLGRRGLGLVQTSYLEKRDACKLQLQNADLGFEIFSLLGYWRKQGLLWFSYLMLDYQQFRVPNLYFPSITPFEVLSQVCVDLKLT